MVAPLDFGHTRGFLFLPARKTKKTLPGQCLLLGVIGAQEEMNLGTGKLNWRSERLPHINRAAWACEI